MTFKKQGSSLVLFPISPMFKFTNEGWFFRLYENHLKDQNLYLRIQLAQFSCGEVGNFAKIIQQLVLSDNGQRIVLSTENFGDLSY